jgi:N-acetylmuramoyl-L-alanine amidase
VVLALAKELKKQLEASGQYRVKLSRENDHFIKLTDRVKFAREHSGDLFISLHADSMPDKNVSGASVYTLSEKASDAQTARLAARENKADLIAGIDLNVEDKDVANILVDLAMRDTMNQSKFFANTLVQNLKSSNVRVLENTHRYAGFAVLKAPDIPSVLIEAGFMSNKKEADMLNSHAHRKNLAAALKQGIDRYFDQVRKNQRI